MAESTVPDTCCSTTKAGTSASRKATLRFSKPTGANVVTVMQRRVRGAGAQKMTQAPQDARRLLALIVFHLSSTLHAIQHVHRCMQC